MGLKLAVLTLLPIEMKVHLKNGCFGYGNSVCFEVLSCRVSELP